MTKTSYSQAGEDLIIDFLISSVLEIRDVLYLDLGANDPVEANNTYYFYRRGARGICIDANPHFISAYEALRPGDAFLCAGIGTAAGEADFYVLDPHTLSSFDRASVDRIVAAGGARLTAVERRQILPVGALLSQAHQPELLPNLLSIDVEGQDMEILTSIDFESWRPAVICAETLEFTVDASERKLTEVIDLLKARQYRVYADTYINTIFVDDRLWAQR